MYECYDINLANSEENLSRLYLIDILLNNLILYKAHLRDILTLRSAHLQELGFTKRLNSDNYVDHGNEKLTGHQKVVLAQMPKELKAYLTSLQLFAGDSMSEVNRNTVEVIFAV